VGVIIAYNFGSPKQVLIGSSCKPFKSNFSVSQAVFTLVGIRACVLIRLYPFNL